MRQASTESRANVFIQFSFFAARLILHKFWCTAVKNASVYWRQSCSSAGAGTLPVQINPLELQHISQPSTWVTYSVIPQG